jgi:tripartite-type tricarboxylate transporter receptor subunit TctC
MPVIRRRFLQLAAGAIASPALVGMAQAQAYPSRPVRMIVPVAAGGANDTASRVIAQKLSESLGQQFIVENHPGGGGNIGMAAAAKAAPDGYTLLSAASTYVINPALYAKIPYDPFKDFAPVSLMCFTTHVVVVNPSVPANNILELVALIRANPGKYSFGSAGTGTPAHLAGELFRVSFGLDLTHVPFQGGGPAMTSTIGGHTPIAFSALSTAATNVKAGQVRGLAITSAKRTALLPDIPTMAESGAPGREADVISGILVPAGTPQPIIDLLYREVSKAMTSKDVIERLDTLGFVAVNSTPAEFGDWIKEEVAKWQKVIREANIPTR